MSQPYILRRDGRDYQAPDLDSMRQWARDGRVLPADMVYSPKYQSWYRARDLRELRDVLPQNEPPPVAVGPAVAPPQQFWLRKGDRNYVANDLQTILTWAEQGNISPDDFIYHPAYEKWFRAGDSPQLVSRFPAGLRPGHDPFVPVEDDPLASNEARRATAPLASGGSLAGGLAAATDSTQPVGGAAAEVAMDGDGVQADPSEVERADSLAKTVMDFKAADLHRMLRDKERAAQQAAGADGDGSAGAQARAGAAADARGGGGGNGGGGSLLKGRDPGWGRPDQGLFSRPLGPEPTGDGAEDDARGAAANDASATGARSRGRGGLGRAALVERPGAGSGAAPAPAAGRPAEDRGAAERAPARAAAQARGPGTRGPGARGPGTRGGPGARGPGARGPGACRRRARGPGAFRRGAFRPGAFRPGAFRPGACRRGSCRPGAFRPGARGRGAPARRAFRRGARARRGLGRPVGALAADADRGRVAPHRGSSAPASAPAKGEGPTPRAPSRPSTPAPRVPLPERPAAPGERRAEISPRAPVRPPPPPPEALGGEPTADMQGEIEPPAAQPAAAAGAAPVDEDARFVDRTGVMKLFYDVARAYVVTKDLRPGELLETACKLPSTNDSFLGQGKKPIYMTLRKRIDEHIAGPLAAVADDLEPSNRPGYALLMHRAHELAAVLAEGERVIGQKGPDRVVVGNQGRPKMSPEEATIMLRIDAALKGLISVRDRSQAA
ncbi:MAG: hypothetical protein H6704_19610 [Myxococcales bacterium]|nr:hypothetical protein [Myxococcales bacterium]